MLFQLPAFATQEDMSLYVSVQNDMTTRSQHMTFDVIATIDDKKAADKAVIVTNNGKNVPINWSDPAKTSYTVTLEAGINELVVTVQNGEHMMQETSYIDYEPAAIGEIIGHYVLSMDVAVAGLGHLVEPKILPIINGENAAHHVVRALTEENFDFYNTGDLNNNFYLGTVFGGNLQEKQEYAFPEAIVEAAIEHEFELRYDFEVEKGLGEFVFSGGSGWMYAVNNVFPNVGFADYYLQDGDVMRIQFTLNLGRDLGGGDPTMGIGDNFFNVVTKDVLTAEVARINSSDMSTALLAHHELQAAYEQAYDVLLDVNPMQHDIDAATSALQHAYIKTLQHFIDNDEHRQYVQHEIQQLDVTLREQLTSLPRLHDESQRFEENMAQLPETITKANFLQVQQLRQQYDTMHIMARDFVYESTVQRLQAAEAQLLDDTVNSKPYTIFPAMTITNRQHPFTITFTNDVHTEQLANRFIVRTSTYDIVPTVATIIDNTVTIRPLYTSYRKGMTYILSITQQVHNTQQQQLIEPVQMTFIVK